jgi:putative acetyltransferase
MREVAIRAGTPIDMDAIWQVHEHAFGSAFEAELVGNLHADGDAILSLIAAHEGAAVGHVLFSRLGTPESDGLRACALGPLGVMPDFQGRGIASALVREGVARLREKGEDLVLVLGDPDFYGRFGFSIETARAFSTPYDGPHQQAMALSDAGRRAQGVLNYAPAFSKLA